ncbi:hypothetical protein EI427_11370 [Flammeovirga pectinis]|uniref:Peptidase S8/S53 domain-containing protein n=1 Tax=Flammeovirga pectinis TaxID=2494373 RepID=A0A3Q9FR56_9BACT|nr:S8 family peptidase [Flammeovirga pectinis]AZQ62810.1 hypothetical protein EI427_11370 [Flammeovirga pectinis]
MNKSIITFLLFSITNLIHAQDQYFLVTFSDKDATTHSLSDPSTYLSDASVDRREHFNIAIDSSDLPVVTSYIDAVEQTGATIWYPSKWFNAIIVSNADSAAISVLPHVSEVLNMSDKSMGGIQSENSNTTLNTSSFGASNQQMEMLGIDKMHEQGYKGEGIHIAVLDAGFLNYDTNKFFVDLDVADTFDFYSRDTNVSDDHRHGANVLSTMAANIDGDYVGGSPNATYYLYRTENVSFEDRIEELMWAVAAERADSLGVDIIQSSLGYYDFDDASQNYSHDDLTGDFAWISMAANHAFTKGIMIVCSAGNEGGNPWQKITFPSDSPLVLTVGSVNSKGTKAFSSSIGPAVDNRMKPDVMALGEGAVIVNTSGMVSTSNGTSFSAPQMASLLAGLMQALPDVIPQEEYLNRIKGSADRYSRPDTLYGYGVPDFETALLVTSLKENDHLFKKVKIFPNPTNGEFINIELPNKLRKEELEITWYTLSGNLLQKGILKNAEMTNKISIPSNFTNQYILLRLSTASYYKTFKVKVN